MKMTKSEVNFMCFTLLTDPDIFYFPYCPEKVQSKMYLIRRNKNKFLKQYCKKLHIKYLGNGKFLKL